MRSRRLQGGAGQAFRPYNRLSRRTMPSLADFTLAIAFRRLKSVVCSKKMHVGWYWLLMQRWQMVTPAEDFEGQLL